MKRLARAYSGASNELVTIFNGAGGRDFRGWCAEAARYAKLATTGPWSLVPNSRITVHDCARAASPGDAST